MMKKYLVCFFLTLLMAVVAELKAQTLSTKSKKAIELYTQADNFRVRGQFAEAISMLREAIEKDKKFEEAYFRLGLTYRVAGDIKSSNAEFENGLKLTADPVKKKNYFYLLAEGYLRVGDYKNSLSYSSQFLENEKFDKKKIQQAQVWKSQNEYSIAHAGESASYKIKLLSDTVNAFPTQYFPTITPDDEELIFTVAYGTTPADNEEIFVSKKTNRGWGKPTSISSQINTNFREGASTISADGRLLIFTVCGYQGCDLYQSVKVGDQWSMPVTLGAGVNTSGWEAQPALSADGNTLYFVSERKGGVGGYDIWISQRDQKGVWQKAFNAGKDINTPFDEIAPFIHSNGLNLFFASNGLPGFGGYDIYMSEKSGLRWASPKNLGQPLNDFSDQYSFVVNGEGSIAYYSKEDGKNHSKIYEAKIPVERRVKRRSNIVKGVVVDAANGKPLSSRIELHDLKLDTLVSVFTSDSITGAYLFVLPTQSEYAVYTNRAGYLFASSNFNSDSTKAEQIVDFRLQVIQKNAEVTLRNIFFEFDKHELNEKSSVELQEVAKFLLSNPSINVEIGGHTDNVGNESYNQRLSEKRAETVRLRLITLGVPGSRLTAVGYGSKKPASKNGSEAINRRILFKVF